MRGENRLTGKAQILPVLQGANMKRLLSIAAMFMATCLGSIAINAQSGSVMLHFQTPFAFTVENATFEAGDYEVTEPTHLILELRNLRDQKAAFEHVLPAGSKKEADGRMRLIFHRYGKEYFLAVVS